MRLSASLRGSAAKLGVHDEARAKLLTRVASTPDWAALAGTSRSNHHSETLPVAMRISEPAGVLFSATLGKKRHWGPVGISLYVAAAVVWLWKVVRMSEKL
jgi:hypothetical protein